MSTHQNPPLRTTRSRPSHLPARLTTSMLPTPRNRPAPQPTILPPPISANEDEPSNAAIALGDQLAKFTELKAVMAERSAREHFDIRYSRQHDESGRLLGGIMHLPGFFFVYSLLACDLWRSWREYVQSASCPLSAQWRLVASTPFALRPGLSRECVMRTKEITKEKREKSDCVGPRKEHRSAPNSCLRLP